MNLAVVGTGYVGLVAGTCFAETGNDVICVDIDERKIAMLKEGKVPIYEPGLEEMVQRNAEEQRLSFTTELNSAVKRSTIVFIAVGTPQGANGKANLEYVRATAKEIARVMDSRKIIVTKSTVPVGTADQIKQWISEETSHPFAVVSNPEFLKEGAAIDDFMKPDRVVVGVRRAEAAEVVREVYAPFLRTEHPFLVMSPESAEMTKYAANAMLATKISFINEMANLCDRVGADVNDVRRGIGHDQRIGFQFLFPGPGYGGSCFPKDVRALVSLARQHDLPLHLMTAVDAVNEAQKQVLVRKVKKHFGDKLAGKTLAVWGLAFKPRTDDIREAPALTLKCFF